MRLIKSTILFFSAFFVISLGIKAQESENTLIIVEVAQFPGGKSALNKFLAENIKFEVTENYIGMFPPEEGCREGYIITRFTITKEGEIKNIGIEKGICPEYDNQAIEIIKKMPRWKPQVENGEIVDCEYLLPLRFKHYSEEFSITGSTSYGSSQELDSPSTPQAVGTSLQRFIMNNLRYPEDALTNNIQGQVLAEAYISYKGEIIEINIIKSLHPSCDKEVIRVITEIPNWTPAIEDGKYKDGRIRIPVTFRYQ